MWKWLKRSSKRPEATPFQLSKQFGYLLFGYGYLETTQDRAIHYFRLRPYLGQSDPCLQAGMQYREALKQVLLAGERRSAEHHLWAAMLCNPPTHTIRFGWKSRVTGACHDIIYLPLSFRRDGYWTDGLARDFGLELLEAVDRNAQLRWKLLPASNRRISAAAFWLGAAFTNWIEA